MRWFIRQSLRGGRVCAFNKNYKSKHCDDILKIINKELAVKGTVYDTIEAYIEYKNRHFVSLKQNMKIKLTIIDWKMQKKKKNLSMKK